MQVVKSLFSEASGNSSDHQGKAAGNGREIERQKGSRPRRDSARDREGSYSAASRSRAESVQPDISGG